MNKDNLEIERKFLLKNVPKFNRNEIDKFLIHQIYVDVDGVVTRFRMHERFNPKGSESDVERYYIKCNKRPISPGVFEEIEEEITQEVFRDMCHKDHSYIIKTRSVYKHGGLNWEVDEYHDIKMVTLEVELEDINQEITIPEIFEEQMIVEVTGQKVFSNQNLSIKDRSII
jgi:CYTH domain-containing protein